MDSDGPHFYPGGADAGSRSGNPHAIRYSEQAFRHSRSDGGRVRQRFADGSGVSEWGPRRRGRKDAADQISPNRAVKRISPGLLAAQGTRLVAGRDFTWEDVFGHRRVALVSENMARENWGEPVNALGKRIRHGRDGPWIEVVGVAENVYADGVNLPAPATVYFRAGVNRPSAWRLAVVRRGVRLPFEANARARKRSFGKLPRAIHAVNPSLPLARVRTLNDVYRRPWRAHRSRWFCSGSPERWR